MLFFLDAGGGTLQIFRCESLTETGDIFIFVYYTKLVD
jgi:hypothetical protein